MFTGFHICSPQFHQKFTEISPKLNTNFTQHFTRKFTRPFSLKFPCPNQKLIIGFVEVRSRRSRCHSPRQPRASGRARTARLTQPKAAPNGQGDIAQSSPVRAGAHEHQTVYLCYASELCLDVPRKPSLLIQPIPQLRHASVYKIWQKQIHIAALLTWPA